MSDFQTSPTSLVYKVASVGAWRDAAARGSFTGSDDDQRDGYIHLSAPHQLAGTLAKHFRGRSDLVLAAFASGDLGGDLRWEPSRGGELFPHLYAPLPVAAALWVQPLAARGDGSFDLPVDIVQC